MNLCIHISPENLSHSSSEVLFLESVQCRVYQGRQTQCKYGNIGQKNRHDVGSTKRRCWCHVDDRQPTEDKSSDQNKANFGNLCFWWEPLRLFPPTCRYRHLLNDLEMLAERRKNQAVSNKHQHIRNKDKNHDFHKDVNFVNQKTGISFPAEWY